MPTKTAGEWLVSYHVKRAKLLYPLVLLPRSWRGPLCGLMLKLHLIAVIIDKIED